MQQRLQRHTHTNLTRADSHCVPLDEAPRAYAAFCDKEDSAIKFVLRP
jgi:threonine dehydrogenase-like Zn-dependent dehydrogenase